MMKCRHEDPCSKRCLITEELGECRVYDKCKEFQPNYITNADLIRTMNDDELYKFIVRLTDDGWSFACSNPPECDPAPENGHKCGECLKRWLQQSAKECK